ncbi:PIR Superfamily Protein [Plasmodium ovale wallikeri]|uniref:PIR Superfamily Protein n=1 Tax=Plasmodium ovale wallikeri TaxID=864142 RepID=A0A1A9AL89_PLAOA|nr:PIR Superfamily Protein [Plasmodium ovale wallikeri]
MTTVTYAVINTGTNLKREQCLEKYHEIEEIAKHIIAELDKTDGENSEFVEKCKVLRTHLADINSDYSECFNYKDGLPYAKFEDLINDSLKKSTHYDKCLTWNLESASKDKAEDQKEKSPEQEEGNEKDINPPRETIQAQSQCSGNYCETEHQSGHGLEGEKQMRSGVSGPAHEETHLDSPSKITDAHGAEPTLSSTSRGESDTYSSPGADATTLKGVRAANQPQIGGRGDSQNDSSQYGKINFDTDEADYVKDIPKTSLMRIYFHDFNNYSIYPDKNKEALYTIFSDTSKGEIGNTELHTLTNEVTDALLPGTLSGHPSTDEQVAGENHGTLARGMPPKNMPSLGVPGITDGHSHVRSTPDSEQVSNADSGVNGRGIVLQNPDLPKTVPESWIYSFKMYIIIGVSILAFTSLGRLFRRKKKKKREDMEEEFKEMLLDSLNQREENIYVSYECLNR